jgi:hypothetical protein
MVSSQPARVLGALSVGFARWARAAAAHRARVLGITSWLDARVSDAAAAAAAPAVEAARDMSASAQPVSSALPATAPTPGPLNGGGRRPQMQPKKPLLPGWTRPRFLRRSSRCALTTRRVCVPRAGAGLGVTEDSELIFRTVWQKLIDKYGEENLVFPKGTAGGAGRAWAGSAQRSAPARCFPLFSGAGHLSPTPSRRHHVAGGCPRRRQGPHARLHSGNPRHQAGAAGDEVCGRPAHRNA